MKKAFKQMWEVWDNIDRAVFSFSIIALILILSCFCCSCNAQNPSSNIPEMEYGDATSEIFYETLYSNNVIDFIYDVREGYFIEYYDHGFIFEEELTNDEDRLIILECSKPNFFEFLTWYSENLNEEECPHFVIKTVITSVEGGNNYRFYLEKQQ